MNLHKAFRFLAVFHLLCFEANAQGHRKSTKLRGLEATKSDSDTRQTAKPKCASKLSAGQGQGGAGGAAKLCPPIQQSVSTDDPTIQPSHDPSSSPTKEPTLVPTKNPSPAPTKAPSPSPTSQPTIHTTTSPTTSYVEPNPVPNNPLPGYFNYDENDLRYGPSQWHRVDTSLHPLREFGPNGFGPWQGHFTYDPSENFCARRARRQSPKDLVGTTGCEAHHEIRTWCGSYPLTTANYERQILPHKLSLVMNRRPCINMNQNSCKRPNPPNADYPRYSSSVTSYSDLMNYDIKIPGEHTINGETFDAEIQMLHMHPVDSRMSSIGVPVRAREGGHNEEFQKVVDEFQTIYDEHAMACSRRRRAMNLDFDFWEFEAAEKAYTSPQRQQGNSRFDPYADALMPTIFFYRYDGSITEPPCKDLTWWVMTDPVIISFEQLDQIKRLLFTHVDEECNRTSVHNADQSVARPLFPLGDDREIQDCSAGSFRSDEDKGVGIAKKCW